MNADASDPVNALRAGAALINPAGKQLVVATGADRVRFLQGIVTGNVADTAVGAGCHAALLTAKAHMVAELRIFVRETDLYLVVAAGQGADTAAALSRYAIMDDFAAATRADWDVLALLGPAAESRLDAVGYAPAALASRPLWCHADVAGPEGVLWLARVHQLGVDGFWLAGPSDALARVATALVSAGAAPLSPEAAETARIAAGEPAWGQEITGDYFPMEVGLDDAIDYTKGCFLGQEPIVRIRDRGHVNWRLVRLDIAFADAAASAPASPGDRLESDIKPKSGKLTSVARLADGRGVGLALLHVSVPAGHAVRIVSTDGAVSAPATVIG